ncbi:hypothetical protein GYMLUDRAFT_253515 [Collybiopsis luxurians FD-317 M1]|uniref:Uncharacterized protein n=1 Tax=Collybiopsis luxurians FD-317 M1 TaxID=944289 RepID=A0A0D0B6Z8_9AGAR|nr:hypothetical protein GYMLUDRAFT_253515 [Collybiopsis luxurians FD-317 M1]
MQEWTAEKLIIGLQLQEEFFTVPVPEDFYHDLRRSAQDAYWYSPELDIHLMKLELTAKQLGLDIFTHIYSVDLNNPLACIMEPIINDTI